MKPPLTFAASWAVKSPGFNDGDTKQEQKRRGTGTPNQRRTLPHPRNLSNRSVRQSGATSLDSKTEELCCWGTGHGSSGQRPRLTNTLGIARPEPDKLQQKGECRTRAVSDQGCPGRTRCSAAKREVGRLSGGIARQCCRRVAELHTGRDTARSRKPQSGGCQRTWLDKDSVHGAADAKPCPRRC